MNYIDNLRFGADPEVFACIKGTDILVSPALLEKFSSLKFLYQDIEEKHPVYIENNQYNWKMDGAAFELTIANPLENSQQMYEILNKSLKELDILLKTLKYKDAFVLELVKKPTVSLRTDWFKEYIKEPKIYQSFIFGCDPDKDAILGEEYVCKTRNLENYKFRHGGGHIHISGLNEFNEFPIPTVKFLAITVGNYVTAHSMFPGDDSRRIDMFGKPGRYRQQKYSDGSTGIEYRTPSNAWINYSENHMEELFKCIYKACEFLVKRKGDIITDYLDISAESILTFNQYRSYDILEEVMSL